MYTNIALNTMTRTPARAWFLDVVVDALAVLQDAVLGAKAIIPSVYGQCRLDSSVVGPV